MATANTAARNARANDFASDFTNSTLVIKAGATTLATHSLGTPNAASNGTITVTGIADATIAATGTADSATLTSSAGGLEYDLTVSDTGSPDVLVSSTAYVSGETSSITSFSVTFPA